MLEIGKVTQKYIGGLMKVNKSISVIVVLLAALTFVYTLYALFNSTINNVLMAIILCVALIASVCALDIKIDVGGKYE